MLLSATSEALARLRVSDLTAAAPRGPSLFEHTGFCKQGGPVLDTTGATGIGKLENGSRPKAISEIARLRRSLPEPDPENRSAISIRSARPPIITGEADKLEFVNTAVPWFSFQCEIVDRAVLNLKDAGVPSFLIE
jgi:hypothetical protein